ncbi:MAG: single-stranded DNA-binding protein [Saprospiraceae bacterium]|nr:single-stranded DNA-binding protein [Bacteroidia bacterium]NNF22466.1 single-stranded DNA-binding protein [Saprospiraceae bacterium]
MNALRNSVQLVGNLGNEVDLKTLDSGTTVASFPLATNEYYKNAKGEKIQQTQWHNIIAWGKPAELMKSYLSKGSEVMVRGKLTSRSYEDKEGTKRYITEVRVNEFICFDKKAETPF